MWLRQERLLQEQTGLESSSGLGCGVGGGGRC